MLRKGLCDYSDTDIRDKGTITVTNIAAAGADGYNTNKKIIFKNCASFTSLIRRINKAQTDDVQHTDVVVSMYSLIEYNDYYSKTSGISLQYCRDVPDVPDLPTMVQLLILLMLMLLIRLNLRIDNCVIVATNVAAQTTTFSITDTKLSVTLSTQDSAKLFEQLKLDFKRTINWNKYQTKVSTERISHYLIQVFKE